MPVFEDFSFPENLVFQRLSEFVRHEANIILSPGRLPIPPHRHRCFLVGKCVLILSLVRRSATEAPSKKDNLSGLPKQLGSSSDFRSWILVEDSGS